MKCSKFSFRPPQPPKDVISVAGRLIGAFMLFSFVTITTHAQQSSHASNSDFALSVKSYRMGIDGGSQWLGRCQFER